MSFAPSGITDDPQIRTASSIIDYIARRLALSYLPFDDRLELGLASIDDMPDQQTSLLEVALDSQPVAVGLEATEPDQPLDDPEPITANLFSAATKAQAKKLDGGDTAPICFNCGNQTQRSGSCYVCTSCGSTTGCS